MKLEDEIQLFDLLYPIFFALNSLHVSLAQERKQNNSNCSFTQYSLILDEAYFICLEFGAHIQR